MQKLSKWQQDFQTPAYQNVDAPTKQLITDLTNATNNNYQIKGLWVQVEVPKLGSSNLNGLDMIISVF